ncbi:sensor histidine kinase [Cohnella faecalis]|uniref:histidine kinase n=2 Tax=Cohnella faecalis TaxID=2315694 RepID=A0A398CQV6_9BACL|nr:sensor histidine kinase [Cohnella faecalis]
MTVLVVFFVSAVLYDKFNQTAENNTSLANQQVIYQVAINLDSYIRSLTITFNAIESKIQNADGEFQGLKLTEQLDTIFSTREDLVTVAVFTEDGERLGALPAADMRTNTHLTSQSWFRSAVENPNHLSFSVPHVQNLFKDRYKWVVSMSKGIKLNIDGVEKNAVLLVDANFKRIDDLSRSVKLGQKGYAYIIDESAGNIIYHPQQQLIYAGLKYENVEQALSFSFGSFFDNSTGVDRLITIQTVGNVGWKIVGVSYMDEIVTTRKEITSFLGWLLGAVMIFVLLITWYMSAKISQPIKRLEKSMQLVERGNFDITIPIRRDDEVGRLSRRFNLMVTRIRELMGQNIQEQEAKRKSELEVLQSQIHPHFLYNTLNSVVRLAGTGKTDEVIRMITSLSKFFRISLSRGQHIIPVADELEHIRNYLIIQSMRYKNKFDYTIEAEEEALECRTMKLVLQPIVENAIYHGIEPGADDGHIFITASIVDGKLRMRVRDDGIGMAQNKLASLLAQDAGGKVSEGSGIGLRNVHERIRLHFGEEYGLRIESEREEGTTVDIWLPCLKEEMRS